MARKKKELRGVKLLIAAMNQILKHPETWDQKTYHCGTRHCFGGWCQILAGQPECSRTVQDDLKRYAYIDLDLAYHLTRSNISLHQIYKVVKNLRDGKSFDSLEALPLL